MDQYFAANAVFSLFSKNYMELKQNLPIRPSEMGVLNILSETEGPHTPVMLAELLGVSRPMITAHLTSLSDKGYIVKKNSTKDKRVSHIFLTDKARDLVEKAKSDMIQQLDGLRAGMGQEEFDALVKLAQKANQILDAKKEQEEV